MRPPSMLVPPPPPKAKQEPAQPPGQQDQAQDPGVWPETGLPKRRSIWDLPDPGFPKPKVNMLGMPTPVKAFPKGIPEEPEQAESSASPAAGTADVRFFLG